MLFLKKKMQLEEIKHKQKKCKIKVKRKATYLNERWYLSAIDYLIIDTQVARRGRQYHSNPPPYKKPSYKSNRPTKYTTRKIRKKIKQIKQKNIDKKTACPKCRNPLRPTKSKPPYKKQLTYKMLNKIIKKNQTNKKNTCPKCRNLPRPTKSNRPTKYQTKVSKIIKKNKQKNKKNTPVQSAVIHRVLQKATDLQNIKQKLVKKHQKKNQTNKKKIACSTIVPQCLS